jgi:4-amino-4-deoxy-L-arabinose transferase-like glycosyltransferase
MKPEQTHRAQGFPTTSNSLSLQKRNLIRIFQRPVGEKASPLPDLLASRKDSALRTLLAWMEHHPLRLAVLIFLVWMIPGLIGHDPWKSDEGYTFGLVAHILHTGDWVVPTLAGEPFMEKPPLFFLVAAATAKLASPWLSAHDGARLACGLFVALACAFTMLTSRILFSSRPAWGAPLLLIGTLGLVNHAHQLVTDNALMAGYAVAIYGFARSIERPVVGGFWLGTGVGVGFMAKGLLAPGTLGVAALVLPAIFPAWRTRAYAQMLLVAFLCALPWLSIWPVALYLRSPDLFFEWFWINNFGRFFGFVNLGPKAETAHYLKLLPWFAFPTIAFAMWAVWQRRHRFFDDPAVQLPTTVFIVVFAVLSASADARELYAMPLLVPLALLGADGLAYARRAGDAGHWFAVTLFTGLAVAVWLAWCAIDLGLPHSLAESLREFQPDYAPRLRIGLLLLALALTAGWLVVAFGTQPGPYRFAVVWAAGTAMTWGLLAILMVNWLDTGMSYRGMVSEMRRALPSDYRCIARVSLGESQRAVFEYFAGIRTERENRGPLPTECDLLLVQGLKGAEPAPGAFWVRLWDGARPGDGREHFWLYRRLS